MLYACRFGPENGDAPACLVDESGHFVNEWVSSAMGFARSDIVRGVEGVEPDDVVWLSVAEFKAKFPQLYEAPAGEPVNP